MDDVREEREAGTTFTDTTGVLAWVLPRARLDYLEGPYRTAARMSRNFINLETVTGPLTDPRLRLLRQPLRFTVAFYRFTTREHLKS